MSRSGNVVRSLASLLSLLLLASTALAAKGPDEDRAKIRKQSAEVLARLYEAQPSARGVISASAGYATFSRVGVTLGVVGGGVGKGLVVGLPGKKETFMRFVEGSAGVGLGIKKYDVIFVFQNAAALNEFVTKGWEAGGQATAAAKVDDKGKAIEGAISVSPGVWVYQVTGKGLAAELGIKGTKYYADKDLN